MAKKLIVAAIDFGTTFSGYAWSLESNYKRDPLKIQIPMWQGSSCLTYKTPTCILFEPDGKFHSFGYKAQDDFFSMTENNEHHEWYYFRQFKMKLYHEEKITKDAEIKDEQGNAMKALDVFAAAINYLQRHFNNEIQKQLKGIEPDDIQWVLTVPAIWNDTAKSFMREAAVKAGIQEDQLILALEPEVAAIYCVSQCKDQPDIFSHGSQYLLLDAGGGTIDITVHEMISKFDERFKMKEINKANGGDWGGTKVDEEFKAFLKEIYGSDVFEAFATQYRFQMIELFREFEIKKKKISTKSDDRITFTVPINLTDTFQDLNPGKDVKDVLRSNPKYSSKVNSTRDKLRMDIGVARGFFENSIDKIVKHLKELFKDSALKQTNMIVMAGGYSESPMLQEAIKMALETKRVIILPDAALAVLKGAVIFGHNQSIIKSRICRYTYGISCTEVFKHGVHPEDKKFVTEDGVSHCDEIFSKFIEVGTEVTVGESLKPKTLTPLEASDTSIITDIVASENKQVQFITDKGCKILGKMVIDMPDTTKGRDRAAVYTMTFGDTELKVTAKDRDSQMEVEARFELI